MGSDFTKRLRIGIGIMILAIVVTGLARAGASNQMAAPPSSDNVASAPATLDNSVDNTVPTDVPTDTEVPTETGVPVDAPIPTDTGVPTETDIPTQTDIPTETDIPTATDVPTPTRSPIPTHPSRSYSRVYRIGDPALPVHAYYAAVNRHAYRQAFSYISSRDRAHMSETAFAHGYRDTAHVDLKDVAPAPYRVQLQHGVILACIGFHIVAHRIDGNAAAFGGWYKVLWENKQWRLLLSLSHSQQGETATIPTLERCRRGLEGDEQGPPGSRSSVPSSRQPRPADFILPSEMAGGSVHPSPLPTSGLGWPYRPRQRTEYDIDGSNLSYRVSVFRSETEAQASFDWQMDNINGAYRNVAVADPTPTEHTYVVLQGDMRYLVDSIRYRNVQFTTNAQLNKDNFVADPIDGRKLGRVMRIEKHLLVVVKRALGNG